MAWPDWIEEIKERYLADEGHLFLLTGDIDATWTVDGERLGTVEVLVQFLSRTRQVVGVVRPGRALEFPNFGDAGRFERLLSAKELLLGKRLRRDVSDAEAVLGLVYVALSGRGSDQAFLIVGADAIWPGHRKRVEPLGAGAPPVWDWARELAGSNDVVFALAPSTESVRPELASAAMHVRLAALEPALAPQPVAAAPVRDDAPDARTAAEAEIAAFLERRQAPPPPPPVKAPTPAPPPVRAAAPREPTTEEGPGLSIDELSRAVVAALQVTVPLHPVATWTSGLPVMDAVARVLADYDDRVGLLELSVDAEGRPQARGLGAEWFLDRWRGDVALDAAAGMLLKELVVPEGAERFEGPVAPHETAVRALAKRLAKVLVSR